MVLFQLRILHVSVNVAVEVLLTFNICKFSYQRFWHPDMIRPLSQGAVEGVINGVPHISAWTCGDGSCGLHALFGVSSCGQMYADGIRGLVVSELKDDLLPMMRSLSAHSSKILLTQVLDNA